MKQRVILSSWTYENKDRFSQKIFKKQDPLKNSLHAHKITILHVYIHPFPTQQEDHFKPDRLENTR